MAGINELRQRHVCQARRLVVKVGTNVLSGHGGGVSDERIAAIVRQVAWLVEGGRQVALVSSGAIGCGMAELAMSSRPTTLPLLQAAASVGQSRLMAYYSEHFRRHGLHAAQILLTHEDFDSRGRYLNATNTVHALFELPCVPVINENDTISTEEITLGENDRLAALVTHLIRAELLILLTCVPGLYAERPRRGSAGRVLEVVETGDHAVDGLVYDEQSPNGLGGMRTKVEAARMTAEAGEAAVIADGRDPDIIAAVMSGAPVGTFFPPARRKLRSYKRWIRFTSRPRGSIQVDAGARRALVERGKSLLPSGVTGLEGSFERGDVVRIKGPDGEEFARGLSNYASSEIERIQGSHSGRITDILGYKYYDEIVHRDNMALLQ